LHIFTLLNGCWPASVRDAASEKFLNFQSIINGTLDCDESSRNITIFRRKDALMADVGTARTSSTSSNNEELREQLETLKTDFANLSDTVRKQASRGIEDAQEYAADKVEDLEAHIRRNPIQATAIAAGIGFLIGAILSR
jgi:ElaB/YqjD/DUF883 family membrane-anchored ribosome-binding protein